tara:strand:- start:516 stop:2492 length:1977 start_codon:yes stop_codon:yes gene_type:complete
MTEQTYYTLRQIADVLDLTQEAIRKRAKRENWAFNVVKGIGGQRNQYSINSLPLDIQARLVTQHQTKSERSTPSTRLVNTPDRESLWEAYERRPQSLKTEAARRLSALQGVERLVTAGHSRTRAVEETAKVFGESRSTLYRWAKMVVGQDSADWLAALVPAYMGRTAKADCDERAWDFFKSQYLRPEAPSVATCYEWMCQAAKENGWSVPSQRTVTRWANDIPRTLRVLKREGEHAMMRLYPSQQRTVRDLHAMYWINGDGYQHNVFVRFPDGTVGRPKTWFWQDVFSRNIVGYRPDQTEHSDMIRLALGDVVERYGIPEHATIDNTRAAANKWLTAGVRTRYRFKVKEEDPIGLMPQLGIQIHWTSVHKGRGHGQAKPVERAFGVGGLGEYVDKHPKFQGAYTGPNVMAKPENYAETAVEWEVFIQVLRACIDAWNAREGRRTEICAGQLSFEQAFTDSYQRNAHLIRRATDAQRRMWMLTAEAVTVQRDAHVSLTVGKGAHGKNRYACDSLIDHVGKRIVVRFDPDRLHECVHIYLPDGRYLGQADCIHAAGFGDSTAGREWKRQTTRRLKAAKEMAAAEIRMSAIEAADLLPDPDPEPQQAPATNVTRGAWKEPARKVVGSDVVPDEDAEQSPAERYRFDDAMLASLDRFTKRNI